MCFHAHPDDEVITTGGTIARAAAEGHRVVLVFATRGELGLVPDGPRRRDAGRAPHRARPSRGRGDPRGPAAWSTSATRTPGWPATPRTTTPARSGPPTSRRPPARLAAILEREAAEVVTIYDDHGGYHHPDHIQVHRVGVRAAELAGTPRVYEATADARPLRRADPRHARLDPAEIAEEMPKPEDFENNFSPAELITTRVDVRPYLATKRAALAAHSSQVDETSFFLQMPEELFAVAFGTEWFIRRGAPPGTTETWLFPERPS